MESSIPAKSNWNGIPQRGERGWLQAAVSTLSQPSLEHEWPGWAESCHSSWRTALGDPNDAPGKNCICPSAGPRDWAYSARGEGPSAPARSFQRALPLLCRALSASVPLCSPEGCHCAAPFSTGPRASLWFSEPPRWGFFGYVTCPAHVNSVCAALLSFSPSLAVKPACGQKQHGVPHDTPPESRAKCCRSGSVERVSLP